MYGLFTQLLVQGFPRIGTGAVRGLSLQDVSFVGLLSSEYAQECVGNRLEKARINGAMPHPALAPPFEYLIQCASLRASNL